jgi:hypothetical protein
MPKAEISAIAEAPTTAEPEVIAKGKEKSKEGLIEEYTRK